MYNAVGDVKRLQCRFIPTVFLFGLSLSLAHSLCISSPLHTHKTSATQRTSSSISQNNHADRCCRWSTLFDASAHVVRPYIIYRYEHTHTRTQLTAILIVIIHNIIRYNVARDRVDRVDLMISEQRRSDSMKYLYIFTFVFVCFVQFLYI